MVAYITSWIAPDRVVSTSVDSNISGSWGALHSHLEIPNVVGR